MTRVLLIGAAGVFGSRLAEGLARHGFDLVLAGRSRERAEALAESLRRAWPAAAIDSLSLDSRRLTAADVRAAGADVVVDAAGPFQGAEPVVARAAVAAGKPYVDLADARDFVAAFPALDTQARAAGVAALTGASSTPALSNAVLDDLTSGWRRIDRVSASISPGAKAPRGPSVVAAVLAWLGKPVRVFQSGEWRMLTGWGDVRFEDFGEAGRRPVSLAETPDLDLMAARHRPTDAADFRAGIQPPGLHLAAWVLAHMARLTRLDLSRASGLLGRLSSMGAGGDDRGAMRVEAIGLDGEGRLARAAWVLVAPPGVGPVVPSLPALAAIRKIARGEAAPGARACVGDLTRTEIEAEMAVHGIRTSGTVERAGLFARALGLDFDRLPAPIRALHETFGRSTWRGRARIDGADTALGAVAARLAGFPRQGETPVEVQVDADGRRSVWRRRFGRSRFGSVLSRPRAGGEVTERFGALSFDLVLTVENDRLAYSVRGWRIGPIPLPLILSPTTRTHEQLDAEGRFAFDVEICAPLIGRLVRYRGWLERAEEAVSPPSPH